MITAAAAVAVMLASGCGGQQNNGNVPEQNGSRTGYSLTFFKNVTELGGADDNILVSPYSAGAALSMLAEGAEDQTREELVTALGGSTFAGDRLVADSLVDVRSANSVWIKSGFDVKKNYVSQLEKSYGAMAAEKDFSDPGTVEAINGWCAGNTEGRIKEIVDQISPDMVMFLINALYFKAPWENAFDENLTADRVFHGSKGDMEVPMMYAKGRFRYASWQESQLVELPYAGGRYSMLVALPSADMDVNRAVELLSEDAFNLALDNLAKTEMTLIMPKFKFETDFVLNEVMQKMGVRKAFTSSAQFGGISDAGIAVDEVRQKCFIEVNEQGSEAAAVTSIGVRLTSARPGRPVVMTVDRPFLFAIVDRTDDNILFMGKVMNLQK